MNTNEVDKAMSDIAGSPVRYLVLAVGVILLVFSSGMATWKRTAERDAQGQVAQIQLAVAELERERADTDSSDRKKEIDKQVKELRDEDLKEARIEAAEEAVDSKTGLWFWGMVGVLGMVVSSFGFLLIAVTGSSYERVGSLVALGFLLSRLG